MLTTIKFANQFIVCDRNKCAYSAHTGIFKSYITRAHKTINYFGYKNIGRINSTGMQFYRRGERGYLIKMREVILIMRKVL